VSHFGAEWRWGIWGELVEDFGEGMLVNRDGTPAAEWGFVQLGFQQNPGLAGDGLGSNDNWNSGSLQLFHEHKMGLKHGPGWAWFWVLQTTPDLLFT
jgi:hypothetical protein